MDQVNQAAYDVLQRPYTYVLRRVSPSRWVARVMEFDRCEAYGETGPAALTALETVATSWVRAALAGSQRIPEPHSDEEVGISLRTGLGPWA
jgi:predicted RNase H-like HicB family nuclease